MAAYEVLEQKVNLLCEQIAHSPQERLASRDKFYQNHKFDSADGIDYGSFEIDFFNHQAQRGVLNADDASPPGSPWWRKVNLKLIYYTELAQAIFDNKLKVEQLPLPVKRWLKYIKKPNGKNWFRAFNATLMTCANQCRADAMLESDMEQLYINVVLYRMMFAQAMEEDAEIFGDMSEVVSDPWSFSVDVITHLPDMQPHAYPAGEEDKVAILGEQLTEQSGDSAFADEVEAKLESVGVAIFGQGAESGGSEATADAAQMVCRDLAKQVYTLDKEVILPHLQRLYDNIAKWNKVPFVEAWCQNGKPVYPGV